MGFDKCLVSSATTLPYRIISQFWKRSFLLYFFHSFLPLNPLVTTDLFTICRILPFPMCTVASVVSYSWQPHGPRPPGSSAHGILQTRILEWVAMTSFWVFSWPRDQTLISSSSYIAGGFFTSEPPGKSHLSQYVV